MKALDVQPPHLRYQPKVKVRHTTHITNNVIATQSIRSGSGCGGRSGLMKRSTSGKAIMASGTFIQKIQRQESSSFTSAVNNGVVGRVA